MRLVSIVIPTYGENGLKLTIECVKSIERWAGESLGEIIVVDDGSHIPDFGKIFEETFPDVRFFDKRYLCKEGNTGFSRTCNVGMREARKDNDVILLNNDTIAENDFITLMEKFAHTKDEIGIIGPKLIYPEGIGVQSAGSFVPKGGLWFDHIGRFKPIGHPSVSRDYECNAVTGACMFIKREVIDKIGLLDDIFQMTFEDADYCLRAKEAGFEVWFHHKPLLTHFENVSKNDRRIWMSKSVQEFWKRWQVKHVGQRNYFERRNEKGIVS